VARATKRKSPSRSNRRDPHRGASLTSTHERFSDGVKKWVSYSDVEIELKKEYWARGVASDSDSGEGKEVQGEDSGGVGEGEGEEAEAAAGEGGAAADEGGLGRSPDKSASRRTAQSPTSPGGDSGKPVRSKEERKKTPWENKEVQLAFLQACKNVNCNPLPLEHRRWAPHQICIAHQASRTAGQRGTSLDQAVCNLQRFTRYPRAGNWGSAYRRSPSIRSIQPVAICVAPSSLLGGS
jgi:hypothetical protein